MIVLFEEMALSMEARKLVNTASLCAKFCGDDIKVDGMHVLMYMIAGVTDRDSGQVVDTTDSVIGKLLKPFSDMSVVRLQEAWAHLERHESIQTSYYMQLQDKPSEVLRMLKMAGCPEAHPTLDRAMYLASCEAPITAGHAATATIDTGHLFLGLAMEPEGRAGQFIRDVMGEAGYHDALRKELIGLRADTQAYA